MRVFISWSGATSRAIAETLNGWLPSVLQAVKPYFSPEDIVKGSRWSTEIPKVLEECKVGLICLTADNLEAPWLMFEAGALSKSVSASRVCPLLFGVKTSDVKGPLVHFQAAPFEKDELKKAVRMMNQELGAEALVPEVLDSVFEKWWPDLEENVKRILAAAPVSAKPRPERDILEEILDRVRRLPLQVLPSTPGFTYAPSTQYANAPWVPLPGIGEFSPGGWYPSVGPTHVFPGTIQEYLGQVEAPYPMHFAVPKAAKAGVPMEETPSEPQPGQVERKRTSKKRVAKGTKRPDDT